MVLALLVAMVALSATQDVAIDAYTIEATPRAQLGVANSVRIASYRIAMFTAGGLAAWLVYRYLGLQFVSRSWFNLDTLWAVSLILVGAIALVLSLAN